MPSRVMVVTARMGAGHDGAAAELCQRLESQGVATTKVDFLDASPTVGWIFKTTYELWLRWTPWAYEATYKLWFIAPMLAGAMVSLLSVVFGRRLRKWAKSYNADAIVSTYPLASVVLGHLRRRGNIRIPVISFITDFAIHPLWVHAGTDLHLCVHEVTAEAVRRTVGGPVIATGPLVDRRFRNTMVSKHEAKAILNIPTQSRAVLVVAGSWGVGELEKTFDTLLAEEDYFPIVVCGKNESLQHRLSRKGQGMILGWTDQMPLLMAASDVLVQNAGGLTSMEAFAAGLPVVTFRPIPGHGKNNALEMERAGVAPYVRTADALKSVLEQTIRSSELAAARGRAMFHSDPAAEVAQVVDAVSPQRLQRSTGTIRRALVASVAATAAWSGVNVAAGAATAMGLGTAHPMGRAPVAYLGVRLGTTSLTDPSILADLAHNHVAAVIEGDMAASNPVAVRQLTSKGVEVVDGGWGNVSDLHVLGQSTLAQSTASLTSALGYRCTILAPDQPLNGVDVAIAGIEKLQVLDPLTNIQPSGSLPTLLAGHIYILNTEALTADQSVARINSVLKLLKAENLKLRPVQALA